jgi:hypothetical protein
MQHPSSSSSSSCPSLSSLSDSDDSSLSSNKPGGRNNDISNNNNNMTTKIKEELEGLLPIISTDHGDYVQFGRHKMPLYRLFRPGVPFSYDFSLMRRLDCEEEDQRQDAHDDREHEEHLDDAGLKKRQHVQQQSQQEKEKQKKEEKEEEETLQKGYDGDDDDDDDSRLHKRPRVATPIATLTTRINYRCGEPVVVGVITIHDTPIHIRPSTEKEASATYWR